MTKHLTIGTAQITEEDGLFVVRFMGIGNFSVGQQLFGNARAALRFIRDRNFRVVS